MGRHLYSRRLSRRKRTVLIFYAGLAVLLSAALCNNAYAQWKTGYADDPETERAACRFENSNVDTGQVAVNGFLTSDHHVGALRLDMGIFGSALMNPPPGGVKRTMQKTPASLIFKFDEGTSIRMNGDQTGDNIYVEVPPGEVMKWVHGFTAGHTMTVTGKDGLMLTVPLAGTSRLVETLSRCVADNQVIGLPKPFALGE